MRLFFQRRPLYDRLWTETATGLASSLYVSTPELKQACLRAAIPWPTSGYWTLLRMGRTPERPPLPPRPPGASCLVVLQRRWARDAPPEEPMPKPVFEETIEETLALVAPALAAASADPKRGDFSAIRLYADPTVGPDVRPPDAHLQVVADLHSLLERAGLHPYARLSSSGDLYLAVRTAGVAINFRHAAGARTVWFGDVKDAAYTDAPGVPLEDRLHEIAAALVATLETRCRASEFKRYGDEVERRRAEARERKRRADERRRELAEVRREELVDQAGDWRVAANIRGFVAAALMPYASDPAPARLKGWADWALREADDIDPCAEVRRNPPERRQTRYRLPRVSD